MKETKEISKLLLTWYDKNKRDLFWREHKTPYYIWLSEIMLQQTRVEQGKHYFHRFIEKVPDISSLANLEEDELLKLWEGLGYYNRARNLQKAAKIIMEKYQGIFPSTYEEIINLPGIGHYTAGAILSIAFDQKYPAVDGNVLRITSRLLGKKVDITKKEVKERLEKEVIKLIPNRPGDFNQALMDLGASICLPNGMPKCDTCPISDYCKAYQDQTMLEIPLKKPKIERKEEERTVFLLVYQNEVVLTKREEKGLLSSMYEFPNTKGFFSKKEVEEKLKEKNISYSKITKLKKAKHVFSHLTWNLEGYLIELDQKINAPFVTKEELNRKYSIPTAFKPYQIELEKYMR